MSGVEGLRCVVTGGSGLVGRRLVEMLVQRGAKEVVSFDIREPDTSSPALEFLTEEEKKRVKYVTGDLTKPNDVIEAFKGADCVWHIAALVGPFFQKGLYYKVNYEGTLNVIKACQVNNIPKLIGSSSPSTRFDGNDIDGLKESDLSIRPSGEFLEPYAETKAMGEVALREACCPELLTVAIAPHQVYGPRDGLFLPNLLMATQQGKLRVFGKGENNVSFTHVDNYCHGLIIAVDKLYVGSPILGKFYIVTDGGKVNFWRAIDEAGMELGYKSLFDKFHLPLWFMMSIAYFLKMISICTGIKFRITPFTVKMLTIHRWFDISAAEKDLGYKPLITFKEGWKQTVAWYSANDSWWKSRASATMKK
mmetsp:Transcript_953/g.1511  ORF Transcript_953/g.1511 Transcript_953/m.1511 type:complete len:364 (-) Transcript_953:428-1519(-)|eukprot:CAMPEP_0203769846 /NCGR_PEP_ID=MMETSP0099_2-20121227/2437_1 /ASSEMBLY_ACC=CAM_ASM_000209 /TAXON_ID=96639 /ORGANISM=" , Strain NY0313808BC1" /LENGTH=363 /DNA_ID=CAMNT_0050666827 /DNA_START=164 /DNA_END=1255 /DNA_ORIENTATION=+